MDNSPYETIWMNSLKICNLESGGSAFWQMGEGLNSAWVYLHTTDEDAIVNEKREAGKVSLKQFTHFPNFL